MALIISKVFGFIKIKYGLLVSIIACKLRASLSTKLIKESNSPFCKISEIVAKFSFACWNLWVANGWLCIKSCPTVLLTCFSPLSTNKIASW